MFRAKNLEWRARILEITRARSRRMATKHQERLRRQEELERDRARAYWVDERRYSPAGITSVFEVPSYMKGCSFCCDPDAALPLSQSFLRKKLLECPKCGRRNSVEYLRKEREARVV